MQYSCNYVLLVTKIKAVYVMVSYDIWIKMYFEISSSQIKFQLNSVETFSSRYVIETLLQRAIELFLYGLPYKTAM